MIREKATEPVSQDTMYAHNMEHLLLQAERFSAGFIQKHPFIADNAFTLSAFNGMRYGNKTISKPDVYILMKNAKTYYMNWKMRICRSIMLEKRKYTNTQRFK